jgi:hypothetical protein
MIYLVEYQTSTDGIARPTFRYAPGLGHRVSHVVSSRDARSVEVSNICDLLRLVTCRYGCKQQLSKEVPSCTIVRLEHHEFSPLFLIDHFL